MNVLLIMSDEHRRDAMGCMRHPVVRTPNLDKLADSGCLFTAAYCNSPLCGPSRSSFITGKYVHEIGCWDQNHHYTGEPQSWGAYLSTSQISVTTIGKLDFFEGVEGGFPDQRLVQHRSKRTNSVSAVEADKADKVYNADAADKADKVYNADAADMIGEVSKVCKADKADKVYNADATDEADKVYNADAANTAGTPDAAEKNAAEESEKSFGAIELERAGPGDYWTSRVEAETAEAIRFLSDEAPEKAEPWVLWLNYLPPHFPLVAPASYYAMYPPESIDMPYDYPSNDNHPVADELRKHIGIGAVDEMVIRRAKAAYYGLCSYVDDQVGKVLQALEDNCLKDDTLIIYTSDHGEHLGDHELWWKNHMYEQATGIPLIISGGGLRRSVVHTPVSLLDLTATIADAVGLSPQPDWRGKSLLALCREGRSVEWEERTVLSEYHAHGSANSMYMIRKGKYKYIYYPQNPPQLFDLEADQREMNNLAEQQSCQELLQQLHSELLDIVNPDLIDSYVRQTCKSAASDQH